MGRIVKLAEIAEALGYKFIRTDLFRTRFATATKEELHEEVVILRWTGKKKSPYGDREEPILSNHGSNLQQVLPKRGNRNLL
jgi:hypothetical protein